MFEPKTANGRRRRTRSSMYVCVCVCVWILVRKCINTHYTCCLVSFLINFEKGLSTDISYINSRIRLLKIYWTNTWTFRNILYIKQKGYTLKQYKMNKHAKTKKPHIINEQLNILFDKYKTNFIPTK